MTAVALNNDTLARLEPGNVTVPGYNRADVLPGVLHIGPGAFHRAHQAAYFDQLLGTDLRFGIIGVSMRSRSVSDALAPQHGLYTLAILDEEIGYRIIGSVLEVVTVDDERLEKFYLSPDLKIVSMTITEKGYCLTSDGALDFEHSDIAADLKGAAPPRSAIGLIANCLGARFKARLEAPDIISCDNLSGNGDKLRAAVTDFARAMSKDLANWIEKEVSFPNTMVDSITPATDDDLRKRVAREAGIVDKLPVQREAFADWVIEESAKNVDALRQAGAVVTSNVAGFETAKLRMLNGAHSSLAYRGLACGFETVAEAMRDVTLRQFIEELMRIEIAPSLSPPEGLDLDAYRNALLARFGNPAIAHKLSQIAWDGSQKLPIRLFGTIVDNLREGRPVERLCIGVASWFRFVRRTSTGNADLVDPMKDKLLKIGRACSDTPKIDVELFLTELPIVPDELASNDDFRSCLRSAYAVVLNDEKTGKLCV